MEKLVPNPSSAFRQRPKRPRIGSPHNNTYRSTIKSTAVTRKQECLPRNFLHRVEEGTGSMETEVESSEYVEGTCPSDDRALRMDAGGTEYIEKTAADEDFPPSDPTDTDPSAPCAVLPRPPSAMSDYWDKEERLWPPVEAYADATSQFHTCVHDYVAAVEMEVAAGSPPSSYEAVSASSIDLGYARRRSARAVERSLSVLDGTLEDVLPYPRGEVSRKLVDEGREEIRCICKSYLSTIDSLMKLVRVGSLRCSLIISYHNSENMKVSPVAVLPILVSHVEDFVDLFLQDDPVFTDSLSLSDLSSSWGEHVDTLLDGIGSSIVQEKEERGRRRHGVSLSRDRRLAATLQVVGEMARAARAFQSQGGRLMIIDKGNNVSDLPFGLSREEAIGLATLLIREGAAGTTIDRVGGATDGSCAPDDTMTICTLVLHLLCHAAKDTGNSPPGQMLELDDPVDDADLLCSFATSLLHTSSRTMEEVHRDVDIDAVVANASLSLGIAEAVLMLPLLKAPDGCAPPASLILSLRSFFVAAANFDHGLLPSPSDLHDLILGAASLLDEVSFFPSEDFMTSSSLREEEEPAMAYARILAFAQVVAQRGVDDAALSIIKKNTSVPSSMCVREMGNAAGIVQAITLTALASPWAASKSRRGAANLRDTFSDKKEEDPWSAIFLRRLREVGVK